MQRKADLSFLEPIERALSGPQRWDDLEEVITRVRQGEFGTTGLYNVCCHYWSIRQKVRSGEALDLDDVRRLHRLIVELPRFKQLVRDLYSPHGASDYVEQVTIYRVFFVTLPAVILDVGRRLGVDMVPVCRFIRAQVNDTTEEDRARMMVDVDVCWDQCEARLRGAANPANPGEDPTAFRPAVELWRDRFKSYKAFKPVIFTQSLLLSRGRERSRW